MRSHVVLYAVLFVAVLALPALSQEVAEIRTYELNKVSGDPPVIDGEYSDEEWQGAEWTGEFYGTRHSFNDAALWGQVIEPEYKWKALYDDEYFYFVMSMEMRYINMNGWVWPEGPDNYVDYLELDDEGYAGWANGECVNVEFFATPNWQGMMDEGWWNDVGENPPAYHLCYFPLLPETDEAGNEMWPGNFGVRGAEGPPFFHTGCTGTTTPPGDWAPITDPAAAEEAGVLPFQLAALPHLIEGAVPGEEVMGVPIVEVAVPYGALGLSALPEAETADDIDFSLLPMIMEPDENGVYVEPGEEWLFNVTCYMDGATLEQMGLGLSNWNDMGEGGFHNAPRGILTFMEGQASLEGWMVY